MFGRWLARSVARKPFATMKKFVLGRSQISTKIDTRLWVVAPPQKQQTPTEYKKSSKSLVKERFPIQPDNVRYFEKHAAQAAKLLQDEQVVAFPTETVYGLGGNAYSSQAIRRIFQAKGRPSDNPLIVHVAALEQLRDLVPDKLADLLLCSAEDMQNVDAGPYCKEGVTVAQRIMQTFWPGPLTLIMPVRQPPASDTASHRAESQGSEDGQEPAGTTTTTTTPSHAHSTRPYVSHLTTAGLDTVGIRIPAHEAALGLLRACQLPLAAPSANLSGRPSPTTYRHVMSDLGGRIGGVFGAGECAVGVESTVVDITPLLKARAPGTDKNPPHLLILRPGFVTARMLESCVDGACRVSLDPSLVKTLQGPPQSTATQTQHGERKSTGESCDDGTAPAGGGFKPRAPGMKYRHYAPQAPLSVVYRQSKQPLKQAWQSLIAEQAAQASGGCVGLMLSESTFRELCGDDATPIGKDSVASYLRVPLAKEEAVHCLVTCYGADASSLAFHLYDLLRAFDRVYCPTSGEQLASPPPSQSQHKDGPQEKKRRVDGAGEPVSRILCEAVPCEGVGVAVMNRLAKAAGRNPTLAL